MKIPVITVMRAVALILTVAWLSISAPAWAQRAPATQPTDARPQPSRPAVMFQQLEQALDDLDLSEQQKTQILEILREARTDFRARVEQLQQLEPRERADRVREKFVEVREQIGQVLDEQQRAILREHLERARQRLGVEPGRPEPATQPSGLEARITEFVQNLRDAVEQLGLSEEQKAQAMQIADELRRQLRIARAQAEGDLEQFRDAARQIMNEARQDLQEILNPDQRETLRELLEGRRPRRGERPVNRDPPDRQQPVPPPQQMDMEHGPSADPDPAPIQSDARAAFAVSTQLQIGQPAPDFALVRVDGRNVQLSTYRGKVLVLLFGNYSSPSFRQRAADYEQLRKQYATRAEFLIIYTREAYPVGEWDVQRNKSDKILIEQPTTDAQRRAIAQQARQTLKITIPVAVDTIDDQTAREYDGFTTAAVIIGRDGTVLSRRTWADTHALRRLLDEAVAMRPTAPAPSEPDSQAD